MTIRQTEKLRAWRSGVLLAGRNGQKPSHHPLETHEDEAGGEDSVACAQFRYSTEPRSWSGSDRDDDYHPSITKGNIYARAGVAQRSPPFLDTAIVSVSHVLVV